MKKDAKFWKLYNAVKMCPPAPIVAEAKQVNGEIIFYDERYVLICKLLKRELVPSIVQVEVDRDVADLRIKHSEPCWRCSDRAFNEAHVVITYDNIVVSGHGWVSMARERDIKTIRCILG